MSGQAAQMNQAGSSGVGGADALPQHQQMQDVVGLAGLDPQFVILRKNMREKIFEYIGRRPTSADWRRRLPELSRRLEDILFRKFSNKNDYYNMMNGPVEPQLEFAIKTLQQNQQMSRQIASSSGYGTMIPTPGITQGTSGNSRMPYVTDNTGLSSSGAGMVPQNASMGTSLPGSVSNGYQHLTTSVPLNSTTSSVPSAMGPVGIQRQVIHMIPTPGFNNQQNVPANPDYSNGAGYFNGDSAVAPHMRQQKQFPSNPNSHQIQHIGGHSNSGIHSSMLENSSAYGLSDGHVNGGMGLHGSNMQLTNRTAAPEAYMNISSYGSSPNPLQQQFNQHPPQRIPTVHDKVMEQIKDVDSLKPQEIGVYWVGMAENVQIMGSFDGWSQGEAMSMEYSGDYARFSATLKLRPGRYEIKFLVDGDWRLSPEYPVAGEGLTHNNILIVE